ncbi:hypothetical protein WJ47_11015 [Burkholderia ubonensis]|uniref:Uncharacterized protein n=1 Tax=Burkholderia ubonensis TaxID=101571 RepID=A0AB73G563_9BURK|nr:hypothetical protein WJ44_09910 [Burkholderia ubonensis]KVL66409.1 hypothetical protein WJ49_32135 [Burkholderia ubonensis]KVL67880.1 hypothetical protein WJ47_11015 [Burkholderia ubonensis]KVL68047.1 hypothetical protein WJ48_13420 [Burkholderia ubonensis]KVL83424.1 hypothetical protein WJ50_23900 [Burkholderia ubonensis]
MHGAATGKPGPLVAVVVVVVPEVVPDEVDVDVDVVEVEPVEDVVVEPVRLPQPPFHFRALADWVPPSSPPQAASMAGRIRERANGAIFRIG